MAKTKKRVLSLVLALVMALSLLPTVAFATDAQTQAQKQIEGGEIPVYYTYDAQTGTFGTTPTANPTVTSPGGKVEISKTIAPTGEENLFDITLTVKTKQEITASNTSPDAAVVLVLDVSGSMGYCADCGTKRESHGHEFTDRSGGGIFGGRPDEYCDNCGLTKAEHWSSDMCSGFTESRLDAAKATAAQFLQKFADSAAGAQRQVAVVTFSSGANAMDFGYGTYWLDVAEGNNLNTVVTAINRLGAEGGTNMDAGLRVAYKLLTQSATTSIDYRNVILLTDGEPTYCVNDSGFNSWSASLSYSGGDRDVHGWGNAACEKTVSYVEKVARAIRGLSADTKLYSVYYGGDGDTMDIYSENNHYQTSEKERNIADWLGSISSRDAFTAANADDLNASFDAIIKIIEMQTKAWTVTDKMGDRIQFVSGAQVDGVDQAKIYDTASSSIVWRLPLDLPQTEGDWHIYTMTYRVRLNNVGTDFDTAKYYLTNGETKLEYSFFKTQIINGVEQQGPTDESGSFVYNEDGTVKPGMEEWTENQVLYFKVPAVKGYQAKLSFTKLAGDTNAVLANAQFPLTPNPADSVNYSDSDTSDGSGKIEFANIPSGYTYTLKETAAPEDYNPVADITVTVKYGEITTTGETNITDGKLVDPAKQTYRDVPIIKTWRKPATETTPDSITVTLKQDGVAMPGYTNFVISKSNCDVDGDTWTYTFKNLPDSKPGGGSYEYTVEEAAVDGYTTTVDGLSIVNTASGKTTVFVTKNWILPEGMEAPVIQVALYKGEETTPVETKAVSAGQTIAFTNLDKYDANGQLIQYTVQEIMDSSYQQVGMVDSNEGGFHRFTFTNTVADEKITISGTKTWNDGGDTTSRPEFITVELYADGEKVDETTARAETNWEYKFKEQPRYEFTRDDSGKITAVREIKYTVKETAVDGYKSTVTGNNITNTRTGTVDLTVNKVWVSQADHPVEVTVQLYANGVPSGAPVTVADSHTFTGLDKYDAQGKLISYSVTESPVEGYTPSYGTVTTDSEGNYQITITNTENIANDTVKVTVTKTWQQPGDPSDLTATFTLVKNGTPMDGDAYTKTITGNDVVTFENLPRYTQTSIEGGDTLLEEITYTVQENVPSGYTSTSEKVGPDSNGDVYFHFTNTITGTTSVSVEKTWVKPADVAAPAVTFTVQRSVDGLTWEDAGTITLASGETSGKEENLAKYNDKGQPYIYQVKELSVPGYSSAMTGGMEDDGTYSYKVTNTINQAYADIPVSKTWIDGNTPDSERPSVTLDLLDGKDGIAVASVTFAYDEAAGKVMATVTKDGVTSDPVEASVSGNTWRTTVPNMPLYNAAGTAKYDYTASEAQVPAGYRATATGTNVTNKRSGSIDIDITKYWVDPGDGYRPDITLVLTGSDGSEYRVAVQEMPDNEITATLNGKTLTTVVSGSTWTITVPDLPEYTDAGAKITYTLSEEPVEGYTSEAVKDQPFAIQNTIEQDYRVCITPEKVWDNMDVEGVYTPVLPESITVALFRDGVKVEGSEQTVAVGEDGSCTFESYEGLERYNLTTGQYYHYEVLELDANGSPVKENGTISFGTDNDYTVTYRTFEVDTSYNLHVTITNTFKVPAKYLWMVKTHYVHYDYNGNQIAVYNNQSEIFSEVESTTVRVNPDDYKVCPNDNLTYVYDADNAGNKTEATLLNQNHLYVLELYYELTDNAPYIPPDTPDPPTDPEDPGTEIPEEPTPGGELPEEPEEPEEPTDIPDENVPEGELPEDIPDEDVPQGEAPKTGDNMSMWLALSGTAALGLVALNVFDSKRKKKEHEDQ